MTRGRGSTKPYDDITRPPGAANSPALACLAAPNMVSTLAQTAVGVAESWYVGRLGTIPLTGLALAFPMFMLMNILAAGAIGGAVAAAIVRTVGASRQTVPRRWWSTPWGLPWGRVAPSWWLCDSNRAKMVVK